MKIFKHFEVTKEYLEFENIFSKNIYDYLKNEENRVFSSYLDEIIDDVINLSNEIRNKYDSLIVVGVGGSNGAARAIIEAIGSKVKIYWAGNDLSPRHVKKTIDIVKKRNPFIIVIAKNFETLEPGVYFRILREALTTKYGMSEYSKRIITIGSKNSLLEDISKKEGYRFFEFDKEIGGRFSAFTIVGILPMCIAGMNVKAMIHEAKKAWNYYTGDGAKDLIAYISYRNYYNKYGKDIEILSSCEPDLINFNRWWVQLFGETEGKFGKGIYPDSLVLSEDLHSMGQYIQDGKPIIMETFLNILKYNDDINVSTSCIIDNFEYLENKSMFEINESMIMASIKAHLNGGVPVFQISLDSFDEVEISRLMIFFIMAAISSAKYNDLNPYNQDGVEAYKLNMKKILKS